jgi:hypothetical protein
VVNGDTVVTGRDLGRYRCAFFPNKVGGSAGWVDRSKLQPLPVAVPSLQDWAGHWKDGDNGLRITVQGGQLHVDGDAYWPSANPTPEQRPYGPNMGQVEARATPRGADVEFVEDVPGARALAGRGADRGRQQRMRWHERALQRRVPARGETLKDA